MPQISRYLKLFCTFQTGQVGPSNQQACSEPVRCRPFLPLPYPALCSGARYLQVTWSISSNPALGDTSASRLGEVWAFPGAGAVLVGHCCARPWIQVPPRIISLPLWSCRCDQFLIELQHPLCFLPASISRASNYLFTIPLLCKVSVVAVLRQSLLYPRLVSNSLRSWGGLILVSWDYRYAPPLVYMVLVLGNEPRALYIPGKHSMNWATFPKMFSWLESNGEIWLWRSLLLKWGSRGKE